MANPARKPSARGHSWPEKVRFFIVIALVVACFTWGGGSRLDIPGLLLLQPLAIILTAALILTPGEIRWATIRTPLLLLTALAALIAIQLIPLPPALWRELPGHAQFLPNLEVAGGQDLWRPLSVTPDLTVAALVGLCIPLAALIGFASLSEADTRRLLPILLIGVALSVLFGLGQIVGGPQSGFYRYAVTNTNAAVGFFANRNHAALFLATAWPMLALWVSMRSDDPQRQRLRRWVAGASAIALLPMVVITGSRAGLVLAFLGIILGWYLLRAARAGSRTDGSQRRRFLAPLIAASVVILLLVIAFLSSRAEGLQRLIATNLWEEGRFVYIPTLWQITLDFLPFGAGFGSFDPIFRHYEPYALLDATYLNHAHNDLLEIAICGGVPAVLILATLLVWIVRRGLALRRDWRGSTGERFAFLGLAMIALTLLASMVDYPLRTPLHAMLFAFASGWLARPGTRKAAG